MSFLSVSKILSPSMSTCLLIDVYDYSYQKENAIFPTISFPGGRVKESYLESSLS